MRDKRSRRLWAGFLYLVLALTFLWCIVDNIIASAENDLDAGGPVTAVVIVGGALWLLGHGIHGAATLALPALYLRGEREKEKIYGDR